MLSICIPVYNFYIASLVTALMEQVKTLPVRCEVICIDDASADEFQQANSALEDIRYIQLSGNIGRARIRNLFSTYAVFDNLLFLDCDSLLISDWFLKKYINCLIQHEDYGVICGGRVYPAALPGKLYKLRWLYGMKRESQPANTRSRHPNAAFMTNNFIIRRHIFLQNQFDERLTGYGHEDTLLGYNLKKKDITIHHIENPVLNGHLETNGEYISKTKQAVYNLANIVMYINGEEDFTDSVSLLRFYKKLGKRRRMIRFAFPLLYRSAEWMLSHGYANLRLFDFYKLGLFDKYMHQLAGQK